MTRFFDFLTARTTLEKPNLEKLFAMTTAAVTLDVNLGMTFAQRAAICFRPLASRHFRESGQDLSAMLSSASLDFDSKLTQTTDEHSYEWLVIEDPEIDEAVTEINLVAQTLTENGFGDQLVCAIFGFGRAGEHARFVYNFKRGSFYPFVQSGENGRDTARELELQSRLEKELPLEPDFARWFPLFGAPA